MKIFTIGYQWRTQDDLIEKLNKIFVLGGGIVLDVRANPTSRVKGMSKRSLKESLTDKGHHYIHLPELGVPAQWRERWIIEQIKREYLQYRLSTAVLRLILGLLEFKYVCLLCMERDYRECHRQWIANKLKEMNPKIEVVHL